MSAHRHDGALIAEFEPLQQDELSAAGFYSLVRTFIGQLQGAATVDALCQLAVREIKKISGFGRVKAYRFDAQGNGTVIAEVADEGYDRYLGLCFTAADLPRQARELYCASRIRLIADAGYQPARVVPDLDPHRGKPLDMRFAALRSVSPVHLQYMLNMGTRASMSVSIVVGGRLWGLVSCHHHEPRRLGYQARHACEMLGRVLSLQIETREAHAETDRLVKLRKHIVQLLAAMTELDNLSDGILALPDTFLGFARADGAAVVVADRCQLLGDTPPEPLVRTLVHWLGQQRQRDLFSSDNVGRDIAELPELAGHVAGLMALGISEIHPHYLVWFRAERVRTVTWAGRPEKRVDVRGRLHPRHSFQAWQETVRGHALAWDRVEIESARELRNAVLGIVLRNAEELAELAGELQKSNKELEAFSYSVSHDLRAPLRHIAGYAELLGEFEGDKLSERGMRFLGNIGDAAKFAGTLVDNLLSFSQMGRAAVRLSDVDLQAMVEAVVRELSPDLAGRAIEWRIAGLPTVVADPAYIHLALRNLLSNAVKYTRPREPAIIEIGAQLTAEEVVVHVRDNGVGFDMQYTSKLFGVFQRLHRMEEFEGTGIGLASVRRIVERHDGRVWAEAEVGKGATFFFTLPRRAHSPVH
jgi:light-regulated signal transduction histidine kinase (bacteriophytochrome)